MVSTLSRESWVKRTSYQKGNTHNIPYHSSLCYICCCKLTISLWHIPQLSRKNHVWPHMRTNIFNSISSFCYLEYRQISIISRTKSLNLNVPVSSCSFLCPTNWSQVFSREWRCSWSSADRRCSNYIWVINNYVVCKGASHIRDLTVCVFDPEADTWQGSRFD